MAAISAGAQQVEGTINGIGERAGNAALEEIAAVLLVRGDQFSVTHSLALDRLYPTSQLLAEIIGFGPQPNKAVVGRNAFAHEAGIHQHGVLANPLTYEIMSPAAMGVPSSQIVLGKHSGRRAIAHRLRELGIVLDRSQLDDVYEGVMKRADRKKAVYDLDLLALIPAHKRPASQSLIKCGEPA
jgi:2-isopropylmalate synthase